MIGNYSSEQLHSYDLMMADFAALKRLESLGYVQRASKTKLLVTDEGLKQAESSSLWRSLRRKEEMGSEGEGSDW